jgi:hypothetical protein
MIGKQMIEGAATADIGDSLLDAYTSAMPIWRRSFTAIGLSGEPERNIVNKIARGSSTAVFLVQCLRAVGAIPFIWKTTVGA